jgi:transcription antitermination factor NusG
MTLTSEELLKSDSPFWFCLKAQPKHEHLAAAALRRTLGLECFSPRIRFRKNTRRGAVWFIEAMFPGYLFARFIYADSHRQVQYSHGISSIVKFGTQIASIEEPIIAALRETSGDEEVIVINPQLRIGDSVQVTEGVFNGLEAVITQLLPAKDRVKILLDFLGRPVEAEIQVPKVLSTQPARSFSPS